MIHLQLPIKAYSVNAMFYGNRAIKRREAVEWEMCIIDHLRTPKIQAELKVFRESFDPSKHGISIELKFYYPHDILYTKKKQLSSKAFDLTNIEKPLVDVLFLSKYSTTTTKNIEIDDKFITSMTSQKLAADEHLIDVKIQLTALQFHSDK